MAPIVSEEYKRKKKRELIQAARKVFIERGFVRTSMQDIMDEAGELPARIDYETLVNTEFAKDVSGK